MADLPYIIQHRSGTTEEWTAANPVLHKAERGVEFTVDGSIREKVGDGVTAWEELPYLANGSGGVDYKTTEQDTGLKALDGSPVYQITINLPTWDGTAAVAHGITGLTNVYTAKAVVAQGV